MPRPPHDDEDARAFTEALAGARKLRGPGRVPVTPAPGAAPRRREATPAAQPRPNAAKLVVDEDGAVWSARAGGIDRRFVRKLATGALAVEARIDLHGRSRADAGRALERLLAAARADGRRCLLVIHGRGLHSGQDGPALREAVRGALTEGPHAAMVLACAAAPPRLGGDGATLVWLRR